MEKSLIAGAALIWWCSAILAVASSSSSPPLSRSPKAVEKWVKILAQKQEKSTKLHFYFHRLGGAAPSGTTVEGVNNTSPTPTATGFGLLVIRDDPLTVGPEPSSAHIGYAQGMSAAASLEDVVLSDYFTLYFTGAAHNGSTLAVLGSNAILHKYRELPIAGGTGVYRLARGLLTFQTVFYNATSGESTVEVDAVVFHF